MPRNYYLIIIVGDAYDDPIRYGSILLLVCLIVCLVGANAFVRAFPTFYHPLFNPPPPGFPWGLGGGGGMNCFNVVSSIRDNLSSFLDWCRPGRRTRRSPLSWFQSPPSSSTSSLQSRTWTCRARNISTTAHTTRTTTT